MIDMEFLTSNSDFLIYSWGLISGFLWFAFFQLAWSVVHFLDCKIKEMKVKRNDA